MKRKINPKIYIVDKNGLLLSRKCCICGDFKKSPDFGFSSERLFQIRPDCKVCRKEERKMAYYQKYRFIEKEKRRKNRNIVLEHYGGKCACCGEKTKEFLAIDHINNDGAAHKRKIGIMKINKNKGIKTNKLSYSSGQFIGWIIKNNFPDYLVLCHNCNCAKKFYGKCPHQESPAVNGGENERA